MSRIILALALLLTLWTPAHATPVTFDTPAILHAPACHIGFVFGAPVVAPGCLSPLTVDITFPGGDPTSLWGTLAYYPTGFDSHAAVSLSQDQRITLGGPEHFALPPDLVAGDYFFSLALASQERSESIIYSFTLAWPAGSPSASAPPSPTPEPATLFLLGTSLAVAGWVARRRAR